MSVIQLNFSFSFIPLAKTPGAACPPPQNVDEMHPPPPTFVGRSYWQSQDTMAAGLVHVNCQRIVSLGRGMGLMHPEQGGEVTVAKNCGLHTHLGSLC